MLQHDAPLSRRHLMGAAGLGTIAVAALSDAADAASRLDPRALDFEVRRRQRPVDLVAPRFRLLDDSFRRRVPYDVVAGPSAPAGTVQWRNGEVALRAAGGTGAHDTLLHRRTTTRAPYSAVTVDIAAFSGDATRDRVQAGLVDADGDGVLAWYDHATGTAGLDLVAGGTATNLVTADAELRLPLRFSFALTSTSVVAFGDTGSGPVALAKANLAGTGVDLRRPSALARHHHAFGASSASGTTVLDRVEAGYFGQLGLRDPHLVTHADGTPYLRDGKAYLTCTNAGLGFFETAHLGVWTLDVTTFDLEQVGNLFFSRQPNGFVYGDHAAHVVRDERRDRWIVATSTWGDFANDSVEVNHTVVPARRDVLHGVHLLRSERLELPTAGLPTPAVGQWDPHLVRIGRRWYVGFVNASRFFTFYPALARSLRDADYTDLRLVGSDAAKNATEGPVLQRFGGRWFVMASNGDDSPAAIRDQYPVYDLTMSQIGLLDAPHPTNIPWPMVIPVPAGRSRTRWLLVTFNGTQYDEPTLGYGSHGDVVVMEAQSTAGREFPRT